MKLIFLGTRGCIEQSSEALAGCRLYIGDGATVRRSMVRREGEQLFGHTPVTTQLSWCAREGVPKTIVTHFGSGIVTGEEQGVLDEISELGRERGVGVEVAYDGISMVVRRDPTRPPAAGPSSKYSGDELRRSTGADDQDAHPA